MKQPPSPLAKPSHNFAAAPILTTTAPTVHRRQADRPTSSPVEWPTDQLELAILDESPFSKLTRALLNRTAGMFDLHHGMTLADYRAAEAYGSMTLQAIIGQVDEQPRSPALYRVTLPLIG